MSTWTSITRKNKSSLVVARVTAKIEDDNGLCRGMRCGAVRRDLHLFLLHPSVPHRGRAPDGCDRVLVQIKFRQIERDGASRPAGRRDGVFGDGRGRKEVLLPQEKVTSPVMDGA